MENKLLKQKEKKIEQARKAVSDEKRIVDGLSTDDVANRLRRRDDDWGRM